MMLRFPIWVAIGLTMGIAIGLLLWLASKAVPGF
jgi:hypothetical protein